MHDFPTATVSAILSSGTVIGRTENGIDRFLGIPYAAAPFGENRFREPQPVTPWSEPRSAGEHGPTSPQANYDAELDKILPTLRIAGEEILNLSVWAPQHKPERPLPVFIWIHGGSLQHGTHSLPIYDGASFATDDVILVGVNYRLGAEGFLPFPDGTANLGLLDLVAALEWVQREIHAFGGDPTQVTIGGESAGGHCVAALQRLPQARGLFHRAIIQSGPLNLTPRTEAAAITTAIAQELGIPATREAFTAISPERLLGAQEAVLAGTSALSGGLRFHIVDEGFDAIADNDIPLLIGSNTEEYRLWLVPSGALRKFNRLVVALASRKFGISRSTSRVFRRAHPAASRPEVFGLMISEYVLRAPLWVHANNRADRGAQTFVYEFAWRTPEHRLGAAHALEIGFVFDTLDSPDAIGFAGRNPPGSLATRMHGDWVSFIREGNPGWRAWDETRSVQYYDALANPVQPHWREEEAQAMSADLAAHRARQAARSR